MVEKSKEYISCLANDKVGICVISLVLDRRHLKSDNKGVFSGGICRVLKWENSYNSDYWSFYSQYRAIST